jgi:formamidopyrimidine-DNA glycosylase
MFELPEYRTLAEQMRGSLTGKRVLEGRLGNSPHKFVWYNRSHEEFSSLTQGKAVGEAQARGRWLFVPLEPGYVLLFGECGGRILFHPDASSIPAKYHLLLRFEDGTALSAVTRMWGAMELYEAGKELQRQYVAGMRPTAGSREFSPAYFRQLIEDSRRGEKRSVKGLLTQDQLVPGLGNAIAQDIMFKARINPRRSLASLGEGEISRLYRTVVETVAEVTRCGGRNDEYDLFGRPGGYVRVMDKSSAGRPCPVCGTEVVKVQYLGGACYFCPSCQSPEPDGSRDSPAE